jgi:RNA polymerase-interacting CarD/CdnL/TRCF family regulator
MTRKGHQERYRVVQGKLDTGDAFQVAETVRDLTARQGRKKLTTRGKQAYDKGDQLPGWRDRGS